MNHRISRIDPTLPATQSALRTLATIANETDCFGPAGRDLVGSTGAKAFELRNPGVMQWAMQQVPVTPLSLAVRGLWLREALAISDWLVLLKHEAQFHALCDAGVIVPIGSSPASDNPASAIPASRETAPAGWQLNVDLRLVEGGFHGAASTLILSDPDGSLNLTQQLPDHVPGVGNAPRSLLATIPPLDTAKRVWDIGCGSGVIAATLAANYPHLHVTGTDISTRALGYAQALHPHVEWINGSWGEPVAGQQFDLIVSNPPFVISPGCGFTYRETPLALDGASATVIEEAAAHLAPGGSAHILAGWVITEEEFHAGEIGQHRVSGWLPSQGIRAWVVVRDIVDIATYVDTWLRDEGIDPRTAQGRQRTTEWLTYFTDANISHVGMGYVHMFTHEGPTDITVELMQQPLAPGVYLGAEVAEWHARETWLAGQDQAAILNGQYGLRETTAIETVATSVEPPDAFTPRPFSVHRRTISRIDGPAWSHDIDEHIESILKGLHPHGLPLGDVVELYCAVHGDELQATTGEIAAEVAAIVVDLIRHGIVLPAEFLHE